MGLAGLHGRQVKATHSCSRRTDDLKATRRKEVADCDADDATIEEERNTLTVEKVVKKALVEIVLRNGKAPICLRRYRASAYQSFRDIWQRLSTGRIHRIYL